MEYNTQLKKLPLPEYGRNIQRLVDQLVALKDKKEQQTVAENIIDIMGSMNPHLRDVRDFNHKLWDHLAIMADFKLDIDFPYEKPSRETFQERPQKVHYIKNYIKYKHFGKVVAEMVEQISYLPYSPVRKNLIVSIANYMKKSYLTWNKDLVIDDVIFDAIKDLSEGRLNLKFDLVAGRDIPKLKKKNNIPRPKITKK